MKRTIVIRIIVSVVVVVFVVGTWVQNRRLDFEALKYFSAAVLASTAVFNLWDFWLWRLQLVQRIPGVPRSVRGTWKGTLAPLWVDPVTGKSPEAKTVYLVVQQTSSLVLVKLLTDESRSTSSLAKVSSTDGSFLLTYLYLNKPDMRVEHRSRIHHGSAVFDISGCPAKRLRGRYWTDRDSKGELEFVERSQKVVDDFTDAGSLF
jgi:predicted pore-forming effector associated with SMODS systems